EVPGPGIQNVQVQASHLGMASHPEVLRAVADRLVQPEDGWSSFRRRAVRPLDEQRRLRG
ncbi:MAG TPA: hypothetical protein VLK85_27265, partial [Ramlibacter sp.]|nr:hypothetical protein [Ramlibacter sp.]